MPTNDSDRDFMEIAIEEMRKSRSEHENKFDPMVGVILVGADGTIMEKAHRGSLRVGEHAEYTLIERRLADQNLEGSTLYVTLEPCTVRQPPKRPCVDRIISARIKRVVIGIADPNPDIQGQGITRLLKNDIEVDFFDLDLVKPIREENKDFIEQFDQATRESEEEVEIYEGPSEKEREPVTTATFDDLSPELIRKYIIARKRPYKFPSSELNMFLQRNGLLSAGTQEGSFVPTTAGVLLFGKYPEDFFVQSKVKLEAHIGDRVVTSDATGSLLSLPEKIEEFFHKNMRTFTEVKGMKRIEVPEYPIEALREALINALVHRDYREGARVIIQMFREKIVIKSPGLPLRPLSLEKIRTYNAPPYSRNPRIADTFGHMNLMEERGWGLSKMREHLLKHRLRPPTFNLESGYFVVTFHGYEPEPGDTRIETDLLAELKDRQRKMVDIILDRGRITSKEYATECEIHIRAAIRDLNKLMKLGLIEKKGKGQNTYYVPKTS